MKTVKDGRTSTTYTQVDTPYHTFKPRCYLCPGWKPQAKESLAAARAVQREHVTGGHR